MCNYPEPSLDSWQAELGYFGWSWWSFRVEVTDLSVEGDMVLLWTMDRILTERCI